MQVGENWEEGRRDVGREKKRGEGERIHKKRGKKRERATCVADAAVPALAEKGAAESSCRHRAGVVPGVTGVGR